MGDLQHTGVKGMKWGVRKAADKVTSSGPVRAAKAVRDSAPGKLVKKAYAPSTDAKKSKEYMMRAKLGGVQNLNNHEMSLVIRRMKLEQEYKDLYGERQWHSAGVKWAKGFLNDVAKDTTTSWLKRPGSSGSGRSSSRVHAWTTGQNFARTIDGTYSQRELGS